MSQDPFTRVVVTDIRMPFWSMVRFMVKWAIAAIPALIILAVIGALLSAALTGWFASSRDRKTVDAGGAIEFGHQPGRFDDRLASRPDSQFASRIGGFDPRTVAHRFDANGSSRVVLEVFAPAA